MNMRLTPFEFEMMSAMWDEGKPAGKHSLQERTHHWNNSSFHIIINNLISKGMVFEAGVEKRTKTLGRLYAPTMSREEYWGRLPMVIDTPQTMDLAWIISEMLRTAGLDPKTVPGVLKRAGMLYERKDRK